jgi:hypothetical protein
MLSAWKEGDGMSFIPPENVAAWLELLEGEKEGNEK